MAARKINRELSTEQEECVLAQAKAGDERAMSQLIATFYPKIFHYVYYRLDNSEDAKDLTNDIFVKIVQAIRRQKGSFNAWIYRIASNAITDFYRYRSVRNIVTSVEELPDDTSNGEQINEQLFLRQKIGRAMKQLTEDQQQVIILRFIEGYPSHEIARIVKKSPESVRGIQFRALQALRKILSEGNKRR